MQNGGQTFDLDLVAGRQKIFDLNLEVRWHMPLIQILMKEGTPLIWAIPSTGSLYKDNEGYKELFFLSSSDCCNLVSTSILSLALESTFLGILKRNWPEKGNMRPREPWISIIAWGWAIPLAWTAIQTSVCPGNGNIEKRLRTCNVWL